MKRPGLTLVVLPAMLFLLTALRGAESKPAEPAAAPATTVQRAAETPAPLGQMTAEQILKHFDKNGDGKLDEDEAADAHEAMLKEQMDRQAARKDVANAPAERQRILEMFDKNHDGRLDDEERAEMQRSLANRRAGGGSGPGFAMRQEIMRRFDKNHDGKIDDTEWAEVSPMLHERLDGMLRQVRRFDKNNDGTIDDEEWATATDEIRKWLNEGPPAGAPPKAVVPAAAKATEKAPAATGK